MEKFKSQRGFAFHYILLITIIFNLLSIALLFYINSYVLSTLLKALLIICDIYQLYYILLCKSITLSIEEDSIKIAVLFGLKKINIPISEIQAYNTSSGKIKGVKLTGYGRDDFALGKSIIDKIGISSMFVTSNKDILYLKTNDMCYGVSPKDFKAFEEKINEKGIKKMCWGTKKSGNVNLFKDKNFVIALVLTTIVIAIIIIIPLALYLKGMYPESMPLSFDTSFTPVKIGTGKQFAFKQMAYGVLNAAVLFFLYYASYFYAKYDRKSAYKYIYISFLIAVVFLVMLVKILSIYL